MFAHVKQLSNWCEFFVKIRYLEGHNIREGQIKHKVSIT